MFSVDRATVRRHVVANLAPIPQHYIDMLEASSYAMVRESFKMLLMSYDAVSLIAHTRDPQHVDVVLQFDTKSLSVLERVRVAVAAVDLDISSFASVYPRMPDTLSMQKLLAYVAFDRFALSSVGMTEEDVAQAQVAVRKLPHPALPAKSVANSFVAMAPGPLQPRAYAIVMDEGVTHGRVVLSGEHREFPVDPAYSLDSQSLRLANDAYNRSMQVDPIDESLFRLDEPELSVVYSGGVPPMSTADGAVCRIVFGQFTKESLKGFWGGVVKAPETLRMRDFYRDRLGLAVKKQHMYLLALSTYTPANVPTAFNSGVEHLKALANVGSTLVNAVASVRMYDGAWGSAYMQTFRSQHLSGSAISMAVKESPYAQLITHPFGELQTGSVAVDVFNVGAAVAFFLGGMQGTRAFMDYVGIAREPTR